MLRQQHGVGHTDAVGSLPRGLCVTRRRIVWRMVTGRCSCAVGAVRGPTQADELPAVSDRPLNPAGYGQVLPRGNRLPIVGCAKSECAERALLALCAMAALHCLPFVRIRRTQ